ncbi:MAG: hypothetical protein P1U65_00930 [Minwuia sp.]|nr:hypothetical protein [Minwuia sp.]
MNECSLISPRTVAVQLAELYERPFGGKSHGRFRIPIKLVRRMLQQKRVWPDQIEAIRRELYDLGYVLHDMEGFWVVVSQRTFSSYRRVNEASLVAVAGPLAFPEGGADNDELDEAAE